MRAALLSVWPSVPAQTAQVDFPECSGNPASCPENEGFGCCAEHAKPITLSTAEPLAQGGTLRIGAPAWPGQMEGKAPPEGWLQLSVNNLPIQPHSPGAADSEREAGE